MIKGICQRAESYLLPQGTFKRVALAGVTGLGYYAAGFPGVIAALGSYFCLRCYSAKLTQKVQPSLANPSGASADDHKGLVRSARQIDDSALLFIPRGIPTRIKWENNSCFCSSVMWAAFGNIPEIIGEIPRAIGRRLDEKKLFPRRGGIDAFVDQQDQIQTKILTDVANILRSKNPIRLNDLNALRWHLQKLEDNHFFKKNPIDTDQLKELLSLLELHGLVREFQISELISGDLINTMRHMVHRVNSNFDSTPGISGDAHEVFQTLGSLIFEGSYYQQQLTKTRFLSSGPTLNESVPTWGDFLLPMPPRDGRKHSIQSIFKKFLSSAVSELEYGQGANRKNYLVQEINKFEAPPQLLFLTLNRALSKNPMGKNIRAESQNMDPVEPDEKLDLPANFSKNSESGLYDLVGVSRHLGNFAHYDAFVKRNNSWFYSNDIKPIKQNVYPINKNEFFAAAQSGYMFFYRRIK